MANEVVNNENNVETTTTSTMTTAAAPATDTITTAPAETNTPSTDDSTAEESTAKGKKGSKGSKKGAKGNNTPGKITNAEERKEALRTAIGKIKKDFGDGSVMKLGQKKNMQIEVWPTGILSIDAALGVGGLPKGRVIEIYGPESSGKSTLAMHAVASCQKLGGTAAYVDTEHAFDPKYASDLGIDIDEIYISQPDNGEQALDITEALVRSGAIDMIVVDSVAALVPRAEIEGDMGDSHVGLQARLMSQALRKLTAVIDNTACTVIFINQLREKVGVMYGNPEVTTGGKALKFYSTIRIDVRKSEAIKAGKDVVGNRTKIKIVKNKVAPPFKTCVVDLIYGEGFSRCGDMLDIAVNMNIIKKSGSFYSLTPKYFDCEDRIGQGRDNARQYLIDHPEWADKVEVAIREEMAKGATVSKGDSGNGSSSVADGSPVDLDDDDDDDDGEFVVDTPVNSTSGTSSASDKGSNDSDEDDGIDWNNLD